MRDKMTSDDVEKIKFITTTVQIESLIAILKQINVKDLDKTIELVPEVDKEDDHYDKINKILDEKNNCQTNC